jgi:GNAT superfamily N-acetyltransferase
MGVTIRCAPAAEADALTALALTGKRHWGYPEEWIEAWTTGLTITPGYVEANVVACAEEGGRLVGFYALERAYGRWRLEHLWLTPGHIGRGLGRMLFDHAVGAARAMGVAELEIEADPNAEGFYRRMGAERVGEISSSVRGVRRVVPMLRYVVGG